LYTGMSWSTFAEHFQWIFTLMSILPCLLSDHTMTRKHLHKLTLNMYRLLVFGLDVQFDGLDTGIDL
jgi:lipoprotein signal peptidase